MKIKELITNADNRLSTTGTIQFLTFIVLSAVLTYATYLDRHYVPDLAAVLAWFGGGLVATKGAVTAYRERSKQDD